MSEADPCCSAGQAPRRPRRPQQDGTARALKAYKGVWVFIEHDRGQVHSVSWELMGEARKLADKLGVELSRRRARRPDEPLELARGRGLRFGADHAYIDATTRCSRATATSPSPRA